jgi:hypothetical protein
MHIYHAASGTPVATILRPARTPKGTEVRTVIKPVTKRLRQHWSNTRIVWRGDSHYGRVEAMEWAEADGADYIFGLAGNAPGPRRQALGGVLCIAAKAGGRCLQGVTGGRQTMSAAMAAFLGSGRRLRATVAPPTTLNRVCY